MGLQRPPVTSLTAPEWEFFPLSLSYMFVPRVTKESILLLHIFEKMFMPHDRRADPPTGVCGRGCGRSWQACPSPGHPLLLAPAAPSLAVTLSTVTGGESSAAGNGLGVSCVCVRLMPGDTAAAAVVRVIGPQSPRTSPVPGAQEGLEAADLALAGSEGRPGTLSGSAVTLSLKWQALQAAFWLLF